MSLRFQCMLMVAVLLLGVAVCRPLKQTPNKPPSTTVALDFMKRYGYLQSDTDATAALYSVEGLSDVIKEVQKYGAIPQTGILDNATLTLMSSRRCGLPDKVPPGRSKRFAIGYKGWKKSKLTYFVANYPATLREGKVIQDVQKALDTWGGYARLKFSRAYDANADIIIAFAREYHGDSSPFDGPNGILAHAYFPYEFYDFGGDVHFDADEAWAEEPTSANEEGVYFYSVAIHEFGHALGLAHSHIKTSIMFPYYQGSSNGITLDYDDVLGMYELYIKRSSEINIQSSNEDQDENEGAEREDDENVGDSNDRGEENEIPHETTTIPTASKSGWERSNFTTEHPYTFDGDAESVETHKEHDKMHGIAAQIPDICQGNFDAVATFRNELFIFKDKFVWRLKEKFEILPGYPTPINQMFPSLPESVKRIDAAYERHDGNIILFVGNQYWVYDGTSFVEGSPLPLTYYGLPSDIDKIDAVQLWDKNGKTYLYRGDQFWRYNETSKIMDEGYPKSMTRWRGVPTDLDAATTWNDGITYFFKGTLYWRFDNVWVTVTDSSPLPAPQVWLGCPKEEDLYA